MNSWDDDAKPGALESPRRNRYFYGKLLDEAHLRMEQEYFNRKRWMLNRLSLGSGVLCGLAVQPRDGKIHVGPGVAIDNAGREIIVPSSLVFDPFAKQTACCCPDDRLSPDPETLRTGPHSLTLSLCYHACLSDYSPALVTDCDTHD